MSRKEVPRAGLLKAALAGKISNRQGADALHLSVRQFQRLKVRVVAEGPRGLLHRLRGRPAPRRLPTDVRAHVAELLQSTYAGFNDCHATEKLQEIEGQASVEASRPGLVASVKSTEGENDVTQDCSRDIGAPSFYFRFFFRFAFAQRGSAVVQRQSLIEPRPPSP